MKQVFARYQEVYPALLQVHILPAVVHTLRPGHLPMPVTGRLLQQEQSQ